MRHTYGFSGAALSLVTAGLSLVPGAPAHSAHAYLPIRGSYYGTFIGNNGDNWQSDLTIAFQNGKRLAGGMNVSAILRNATFTGTCLGHDRFRFSGRSAPNQRTVRFRMTGVMHTDDATGNTTLQGDYVLTGAIVQRGSFTVMGRTGASE